MLLIRKFEVKFDKCSRVSAEDKRYNKLNKSNNTRSVGLEIYTVEKYALRTVHLFVVSIRGWVIRSKSLGSNKIAIKTNGISVEYRNLQLNPLLIRQFSGRMFIFWKSDGWILIQTLTVITTESHDFHQCFQAAVLMASIPVRYPKSSYHCRLYYFLS
jgi:hypothetical protein